MSRSRRFAIYDDNMGLFRRRAKKNREEAAAGLVKEQTRTAGAQAEAARPEVTAEARPNPVTAEARPNPDQPGWGRIVGQEIGRSRDEHAN